MSRVRPEHILSVLPSYRWTEGRPLRDSSRLSLWVDVAEAASIPMDEEEPLDDAIAEEVEEAIVALRMWERASATRSVWVGSRHTNC